MEGSKPRGAKLIFDSSWQEAHTLHGQWLAHETSDASISGWLRFGVPIHDGLISEDVRSGLGLRGATRVEIVLHPKVLAFAVGMMRGTGDSPDISAVTPVLPATVATMAGSSRVINARVGDRTEYGTAVAVDDGCFLIYGVFAAKDGRQLSGHDLDFLNSTIRLERYEPAPVNEVPAARPRTPPTSSRFEDFRRALGLDQPGGKQ